MAERYYCRQCCEDRAEKDCPCGGEVVEYGEMRFICPECQIEYDYKRFMAAGGVCVFCQQPIWEERDRPGLAADYGHAEGILDKIRG